MNHLRWCPYHWTKRSPSGVHVSAPKRPFEKITWTRIFVWLRVGEAKGHFTHETEGP